MYLTARRLHEVLAGQCLLVGELRHPSYAEHNLAGRTVTSVRSVGKHIFTRFNDGLSLHSHLRMDGSWHVSPSDHRQRQWHRPAHQARAVLTTAQHTVVGFALHDLELLATAHEARLVGHLGPDLLDPAWSEQHATQAADRLAACGAAEIGIALLDQRVMAGIGNLYKNELCFLLGVSPFAATDTLPAIRVVALARRLLLANATRPHRSTTGKLASGQQYWVYERGGKPCRRCGERILRQPQGEGIYARGTYTCHRCQNGN